MTQVFIYGLREPDTGLIRYIGKTIRPKERLMNHLNERSRCHRVNWFNQLKARGLKPEMVFLEAVTGEWPWQESERFWIAYGRSEGWPLVNGTSGGDGVSDMSEESRERIRSAWIGRKHSDETKAKIGVASRKHRHSVETRQLMSKAQSGRVITWSDKLSVALRKFTPEMVVDIKRRLDAGELGRDLAAEYKVHRTTISKIKMGTYHDRYRA